MVHPGGRLSYFCATFIPLTTISSDRNQPFSLKPCGSLRTCSDRSDDSLCWLMVYIPPKPLLNPIFISIEVGWWLLAWAPTVRLTIGHFFRNAMELLWIVYDYLKDPCNLLNFFPSKVYWSFFKEQIHFPTFQLCAWWSETNLTEFI